MPAQVCPRGRRGYNPLGVLPPTTAMEGRTGFEPVKNCLTNSFLSHLDHDPVGTEGIEPTTDAGCGPAALPLSYAPSYLRADEGTRTPNTMLRRHQLYPLSYTRMGTTWPLGGSNPGPPARQAGALPLS